MKNLIYAGLTLALAGMIMTRCSKDESNPAKPRNKTLSERVDSLNAVWTKKPVYSKDTATYWARMGIIGLEDAVQIADLAGDGDLQEMKMAMYAPAGMLGTIAGVYDNSSSDNTPDDGLPGPGEGCWPPFPVLKPSFAELQAALLNIKIDEFPSDSENSNREIGNHYIALLQQILIKVDPKQPNISFDKLYLSVTLTAQEKNFVKAHLGEMKSFAAYNRKAENLEDIKKIISEHSSVAMFKILSAFIEVSVHITDFKAYTGYLNDFQTIVAAFLIDNPVYEDDGTEGENPLYESNKMLISLSVARACAFFWYQLNVR